MLREAQGFRALEVQGFRVLGGLGDLGVWGGRVLGLEWWLRAVGAAFLFYVRGFGCWIQGLGFGGLFRVEGCGFPV